MFHCQRMRFYLQLHRKIRLPNSNTSNSNLVFKFVDLARTSSTCRYVYIREQYSRTIFLYSYHSTSWPSYIYVYIYVGEEQILCTGPAIIIIIIIGIITICSWACKYMHIILCSSTLSPLRTFEPVYVCESRGTEIPYICTYNARIMVTCTNNNNSSVKIERTNFSMSCTLHFVYVAANTVPQSSISYKDMMKNYYY